MKKNEYAKSTIYFPVIPERKAFYWKRNQSEKRALCILSQDYLYSTLLMQTLAYKEYSDDLTYINEIVHVQFYLFIKYKN